MALSAKLLRAWIWTKLSLMALVLIYTTLFVYNNSGGRIALWFFPRATAEDVPVLLALVGAFLLGGLLTLLVRMVSKTIRQMRRATEKERTDRLEREIAEMRTKSASLRTRDETQQGV